MNMAFPNNSSIVIRKPRIADAATVLQLLSTADVQTPFLVAAIPVSYLSRLPKRKP